MATPTWHDLIRTEPLTVREVNAQYESAFEINCGDSYDNYLVIGHRDWRVSDPDDGWECFAPGYSDSYPRPYNFYFRAIEDEFFKYEVSTDSNFTNPIHVGAGSDSAGYRLRATKPHLPEWESYLDNSLPWGFDLYSGGSFAYFNKVTAEGLYINRTSGIHVYWVDESTTPATITEIVDTPDPPDPPVPETYDFSPVSYFKGNRTFFQMSMIKKSFTNGGEPLNSVQSTAFERLLPHDDLESLTHGIATGVERFFAYTDDDNYVGIVRDGVDAVHDTTTYTINFYTDGVFTNYVTYLCNNSNKYHFSFLIDKAHEVARPSIIREYPSPTNPSLSLFDLNKESDIYITDEHMAEWYIWLSTSTDTEIPDPYSFGGNSETTSSTTGNYERGSDNVGVPALPTFNASSLGFFRAYLGNKPNYDTISDLSDYLWSNGFDLDTFKKIMANPIQSVLSIHLIPLAISSNELGHSVHLGNIDTGLSMQPVENQFVELDCGTLNVSEYYGSYLDYSPYTRLSLYLPFIGIVSLGVDEVMGKAIGVKYHIDLYTGSCVAFVTADGVVLYHFPGMCAINIPITSADASAISSSAISIGSTVATVIATAATGGAAAPLIIPSVANTATNVLAGKAHTLRSGSLSSSIGFMDNPIPYIILEIPEQCHPEDFNKFRGYPTHATFLLSELSGYTVVEEVHLENMTCTEREVQEIETLLKGGVIL